MLYNKGKIINQIKRKKPKFVERIYIDGNKKDNEGYYTMMMGEKRYFKDMWFSHKFNPANEFRVSCRIWNKHELTDNDIFRIKLLVVKILNKNGYDVYVGHGEFDKQYNELHFGITIVDHIDEKKIEKLLSKLFKVKDPDNFDFFKRNSSPLNQIEFKLGLKKVSDDVAEYMVMVEKMLDYTGRDYDITEEEVNTFNVTFY